MRNYLYGILFDYDAGGGCDLSNGLGRHRISVGIGGCVGRVLVERALTPTDIAPLVTVAAYDHATIPGQ